MNKPVILKGEVKEFIDSITELKQGLNKEPDRHLRHSIEIIELMDFYSQLFKPEMITEYFEGWMRDENKREYRNRPDRVKFYGDEVMVVKSSTMDISKTLSQFITNCIQAGIKLTWRE
jgi:hypothetical protein